jgi:C_GCAxxG_C_C family probable redox protein
LRNVFSRKRQDTETRHDRVDQALERFSDGFNCTQAIAATYGPDLGLEAELGLKVAGAFGSGMGTGETCGAVTGALIIIGLKHSMAQNITFLSRDRTYELAADFIRKFKARNKTSLCRELIGCDLSTEEGQLQARKEKHFKKRCPKFVQDAAEILDEMLKD